MYTMKTRLTMTLDPKAVRKAKSLAHFRHTSVSGLVEDLLLSARSDESRGKPTFVEKWGGALRLSRRRDDEPRFQGLKAKYGL